MNRRVAQKVMVESGTLACWERQPIHRRITLERAAMKLSGKGFERLISEIQAETIRHAMECRRLTLERN